MIFSSADNESEIGDRKLESWSFEHVEYSRCFKICVWFLWFLLILFNVMVYQMFRMLLIRFWYFDMFYGFGSNRRVHKRTFEGDGEKPSRHEHEGPLLILFLYFWFMMDVSQTLWKPSEFTKGKNCVFVIFLSVFCVFCLFCFFLFVTSADRESEIGDRKLRVQDVRKFER